MRNRLLLTIALLVLPGPIWAQTPIVNPTILEFDPSPDHATVTSYTVQAAGGVGVPLVPPTPKDIGKPMPNAAGKITIPLSLIAPIDAAGGAGFQFNKAYTIVVTAVSAGGSGGSTPSNPFVFQLTAPPPMPPRAPTGVVVR